ncbi:MAG: ADOP family duplicated permease [Bryobacteraceae bacterium]
MRRFFARLWNLLWPARAEREMSREIEAHLDLLEDEFERRGMPRKDARLAALRAYGGVEQAKELHRGERSFLAVEQTLRDFRHAFRGLGHNPGFTLVAVLTLALGIGVNTALFTTYDAVALKPLPVADPDSVVRIERWFESGSRGNVQYAFSQPEYDSLRDGNRVFSSLVASSWPVRAAASVPSGTMLGQLVSADYFSALGIATEFGRTFLPEEGRGSPVIVLSHSAWQRYFLSDPGILERAITVNGTAFTVIGVTPEAFTGTLDVPQAPDFWAPLAMQARLIPRHNWRQEPAEPVLQLLGRLKPAWSRQQATADVNLVVRRFDAQYPQQDRTRSVTLQSTALFGNTEDPRFQAMVAGVMFVVGLVLLAACANIANMLLARGASRQREISIRMALGAGRGRVVRQLLAESLLLALLGGIAGLAVSVCSTGPLRRIAEQTVSSLGLGITLRLDLSPDSRVFGYVLLLSLATGILFGLSPALQFTRTDLNSSLRDEGTAFGPRLSHSRLRSLLIAGQVTVSMMLLIIAGFLARGLLRSRTVDPGFETRRVYVLSGDFANDPRLVDRLRELPGVRAATLGERPLTATWTPPIVAGGPLHTLAGRTLVSGASETYFETLGIALRRGRTFTRPEIDRQAPVAVISESTAHFFWPGSDPIGQRFSLDLHFDGKFTSFEVIGLVKDVRFANLTRLDPAHVYLPIDDPNNGILMRLDGDPRHALAAVRSTVETFDGKLAPGVSLVSLEDGPVRLQRMMSAASAMFACTLAGLALLLAGVGVYGVMAYLVSRRVKEIGIRMALGASQTAVLRAVVLDGLRPVVAGMVLGILLAAGISGLLHTLLAFPGSADFTYGVPFYDPATFLGLAAFVFGVAAIASSVPARRAVRVDPMVALRHD